MGCEYCSLINNRDCRRSLLESLINLDEEPAFRYLDAGITHHHAHVQGKAAAWYTLDVNIDMYSYGVNIAFCPMCGDELPRVNFESVQS